MLPKAKDDMRALLRRHREENERRLRDGRRETDFPESHWRDYFVYLRDKIGVERNGRRLSLEEEMAKVRDGTAEKEIDGRLGSTLEDEDMGDEEEEFRPDLNASSANADTPGGAKASDSNSIENPRKRNGLSTPIVMWRRTLMQLQTTSNTEHCWTNAVSNTQDLSIMSIPDTPTQSQPGPSGNRKQMKSSGSRMKRLQQLNQVHEAYYSTGTEYGVPSSAIMYKLSQDLNRSSNDLLWLALVALTDHYVKDYMDHNTYSSIVQVYRQEVLGKNSDGPRYYVEEQIIDDVTTQVKVPISDDGRIEFTEEYRFMLHRHWSLYDAMYYSRFVSSRLGIWKMDGKDKLNTFMARMGVSLKESKQKFSFMSNDLKDRLRDKIDEFADDYGLTDIVYGSFVRFVGFGNKFSAADYAFAITAALEVGNGLHGRAGMSMSFAKKIAASGQVNGSGNGGANSNAIVSKNASGGNEDESRALVLQEANKIERRRTEDRFNAAYKVLSGRSLEDLERVTKLSMEIQRAVVRQGIAIVEQKKLINAGKFRYAFIDTMSHGDMQFFLKPTLVAKLGLWLVEAAREAGKRRGRGNCLLFCVC